MTVFRAKARLGPSRVPQRGISPKMRVQIPATARSATGTQQQKTDRTVAGTGRYRGRDRQMLGTDSERVHNGVETIPVVVPGFA